MCLVFTLPCDIVAHTGVYHLGQDNGTLIDKNLCYNVSSHGYAGNAFYTDAGSSNVTISNNVAHDIKCAGFQEDFGMDNSERLLSSSLLLYRANPVF